MSSFPDFHEGGMATPSISFHAEDVPMPWSATVPHHISDWVKDIIQKEGKILDSINYIFCSDAYLHRINLTYLQHDTYTDIITFPLSEHPIESDIYISTERVQDNAQSLGIPFLHELQRVMIHGVLHLCGYPDKTAAEAQIMRQKEDWALSILRSL